ncbi:MAG: prolyl oligopeptidase family serine peptidase [Clostridiales bacterium]|nr:prolyl oligopeptidase family serine peptidase [Clostridiales bacterium]
MEIIVRNNNIEGVPLLELFRMDQILKKPMIIVYHGYLGRKEFILPQAYLLAVNGFFVVVPDAYGHGERSSGQIVDLFTSITKSVSEINMIIDSYKDSREVDYTRVGLAGYSMGGCITFSYITLMDKKIKAAVPVISTPDWVSIVERLKTDEMMADLKARGILSHESQVEEYLKIAETIQPINRYEAMKDTPLLMLCGEKDSVTPPAGVKKLYEMLRPIFFDKSALKYSMYPGVGHSDTTEMNLELSEWMKRFV